MNEQFIDTLGVLAIFLTILLWNLCNCKTNFAKARLSMTFMYTAVVSSIVLYVLYEIAKFNLANYCIMVMTAFIISYGTAHLECKLFKPQLSQFWRCEL